MSMLSVHCSLLKQYLACERKVPLIQLICSKLSTLSLSESGSEISSDEAEESVEDYSDIEEEELSQDSSKNSLPIPIINDATGTQQNGLISISNESLLTVTVDEKDITDDGFYVMEYSNGVKYVLSAVTSKLIEIKDKNRTNKLDNKKNETISESHDAGINGVVTVPDGLRFFENVFINEVDREIEFAEWKTTDIDEFVLEITKYFGKNAKLILVPSRFTDVEKKSAYNLNHVLEAYNVPVDVCIESTYNIKSYIRWCNHTSAILFTRNPEDAKRVITDATTFKARPMEKASPLAVLTAYSIIPDVCRGFVTPPPPPPI